MGSKISIIIPAYNEEKRIGRTLEEYSRFFKERIKNKEIISFEIIVVLNACRDRTIDVVKGIKNKHKEIICLDFKHGGKGFAIVEGFKESLNRDSDTIGFVDADMATSPEEFYRLIKSINNYGGAIASRYVKGAVVEPKRTVQRMIASRIFNFLVRILFLMPYRDTQCGAKVFKRTSIDRILPRIGMTKWAFDVDLLYQLKKEKIKIYEYPTYWNDKEYSKINLKDAGPSMFLAVIRLRLLNSYFKDFVRLYNKISEKFRMQM